LAVLPSTTLPVSSPVKRVRVIFKFKVPNGDNIPAVLEPYRFKLDVVQTTGPGLTPLKTAEIPDAVKLLPNRSEHQI